jgi:hypothetical protein
MNLQEAYRDCRDMLTYVALYAPDPPAPGALTAEAALQQLFSLYSNLRIREKDGGALDCLNFCHKELRAGRDFFHQGDTRAGRDRMREAQQYLDLAQSRKSHVREIGDPN